MGNRHVTKIPGYWTVENRHRTKVPGYGKKVENRHSTKVILPMGKWESDIGQRFLSMYGGKQIREKDTWLWDHGRRIRGYGTTGGGYVTMGQL
jgi:hypothetical protein